MKELSVFIDESGDFGEITERPAYYRRMKLLQMLKSLRIIPRILDLILSIYIRGLL